MKYIFTIIFLMITSSQSSFGQHPRTEHWHMRNNQFIRQLSTTPKGKTIFLGNSITEGFQLNDYFPKLQPLNRGISGDHIDGLLERLETSVIKLKPTRLLVLIGINDIGAGDSDSLILKNYKMLMDTLADKLSYTTIYIQSILPTSTRWENCPKEKIIRLNKKIKALAKAHGFIWINLYDSFVDKQGYLQKSLTVDGLHLNQQGYLVWCEILKGIRIE